METLCIQFSIFLWDFHTSGFTPAFTPVLASPLPLTTLTCVLNSSHQIPSQPTTITTRNNRNNRSSFFSNPSHTSSQLSWMSRCYFYLPAKIKLTHTSFPLMQRTFEQLFSLWHEIQILIEEPDTLNYPFLMFHSFPIAVVEPIPFPVLVVLPAFFPVKCCKNCHYSCLYLYLFLIPSFISF